MRIKICCGNESGVKVWRYRDVTSEQLGFGAGYWETLPPSRKKREALEWAEEVGWIEVEVEEKPDESQAN